MAVVINHSDPGAVPGASTIRDRQSAIRKKPVVVVDILITGY